VIERTTEAVPWVVLQAAATRSRNAGTGRSAGAGPPAEVLLVVAIVATVAAGAVMLLFALWRQRGSRGLVGQALALGGPCDGQVVHLSKVAAARELWLADEHGDLIRYRLVSADVSSSPRACRTWTYRYAPVCCGGAAPILSSKTT